MIINTSNPVVAIAYKYLADMNERYTRKVFAGVLLISTLAIFAIYGFGTDWNELEKLQHSTIQQVSNISLTENISQEDALNQLSQDQGVLEEFNNAIVDIMPSGIWLCLIMLLTIPAIIKRTNDTIFNRSSSYPVAIYYALYTLQGLTGLSINLFGLYSALSIYTFFFVFIVSLLPTKTEEEK